ncbi:MAG TPA: GNAT family N-acetyltransferase [Gaiellaceae bacterium]|nr:GNAT family N-acetyltransferase [Gaiellaceae bacterium]
MEIRLRPARADDAPFLADMLREAAAWRRGDLRSLDEVLADPHSAVYVDGWGREGDVGIVAEDEGGVPVGAAWYRTFAAGAHGYGYVGPAVPEVALAVRPESRRRGVGAALLAALADAARTRGVRALSLSVESDNPAVRLYERAGFRGVALVHAPWTRPVGRS